MALPIISPTALKADHEGRVLFVQASTLLTRLEPALPAFEHHDSLLVNEAGTLAFRFDELGRHLATLDALTGVSLLEFGYDAQGLLTSITDRDGNRTVVERDVNGRATSIVGPYGQRTKLSIDDRGLLTRVENAAGEAYTFEYDDGGLMTAMVAPRSPDERHVFSYDDAGRLVRDESPTGFYQTLSRKVSDDGVEVIRTERDVRKYTYTLQRRGDDKIVRRQVNAAGVATAIETGAVTFVQAPTHSTTTTVEADPRFGMQAPYDAVSTLEIENGPKRVTEKRREARLEDKDNPLSLQAYYESVRVNDREGVAQYDASTRTLTVVSPMGRVRTEQRDARGRPTRVQAGTQLPIVYAYDERGRVVKVTQGDRALSYAYGTDGRVSAMTDALGQRMQLGYDQVGRPNRVVFADGGVLWSGYDANGQRTSVEPPGRDAHLFTYAPGDLLTSYAPPALSGSNMAATATRYYYDPYEALSEVAPPGGESIVMRYEDASGRLLSATLPGDAAYYTYVDATGQVATVRSQDATLSYEYLGPLLASVSWSGDVAGTVSFDYDDNLWLQQLSVGDQSVTYDHDDDGLVTRAGAQVLQRDEDNGWVVGSEVGGVAETFAYSGYGELVEHTSRHGGSVLYAREETRDALGRVVAREETVEGDHHSYEYTYDARGQLQTVTVDGSTRNYRYDANGNRVEATDDGRTIAAAYDSQDRLVRYGDTQYAYTPRGSLAEKRRGDEVTRYDYDLRGALRGVDLPDGRQITYLIDGLGRRIGKRIDGALVQGLLYKDLLNPVAELDGNGALRSIFVYASRSHVPDYMLRAGTTYKLISDAIGSVRLVVDTATGEVVQRLDYDEFGNVLLDTNPGFQPFGFAGGVYDADTGLVRFGARDYDAYAGRWTARDPILFGGGQANLYAYVGSDPVNRIDPSGLFFVSGGVGALIGGTVGALGAYAQGQSVAGGFVAGAVGGFMAGSGAWVATALAAEIGGLGGAALGAYMHFGMGATANAIQQGTQNMWAQHVDGLSPCDKGYPGGPDPRAIGAAGAFAAIAGVAGIPISGGAAAIGGAAPIIADAAMGWVMGAIDLAAGAFFSTHPVSY